MCSPLLWRCSAIEITGIRRRRRISSSSSSSSSRSSSGGGGGGGGGGGCGYNSGLSHQGELPLHLFTTFVKFLDMISPKGAWELSLE